MKIPLPPVRRKARIEIIPLIDVVFFLLATFVMVSLSMVRNQGINVNLPSARTGVSQERNVSVTITVTEQGDVLLDKEHIAFEALPTRLKELKAANPDTKVFINGDKKVFFETAIRVLDEVRAAGITKVAIQTKGSSNPTQ